MHAYDFYLTCTPPPPRRRARTYPAPPAADVSRLHPRLSVHVLHADHGVVDDHKAMSRNWGGGVIGCHETLSLEAISSLCKRPRVTDLDFRRNHYQMVGKLCPYSCGFCTPDGTRIVTHDGSRHFRWG